MEFACLALSKAYLSTPLAVTYDSHEIAIPFYFARRFLSYAAVGEAFTAKAYRGAGKGFKGLRLHPVPYEPIRAHSIRLE